MKKQQQPSSSSSSAVIMLGRALWPTSHTLLALKTLTQTLLMTGNQLRHRSYTAQPTVSGYHTKDCQWKRACVCVWEWKRQSELSVWSTVCVCVRVCVKTPRMHLTTSDSRLAGLNIWCRYEITVKISCSRSSWVRVSAIVSSGASQRNERNSTAW